MIRVGLTGSIAMGKTTTARLFAERGAPVHDADEAVRRLYATGGAAVEPIRAVAPDVIVEDAVDRDRLKRRVAEDPAFLKRLEALVHPLVEADRRRFEQEAREAGADVVVFDVPLLFETGGDAKLDAVVVATTTPEEQRRRALARPGMTPELFERLLSQQTPDAEKRRRADFIVDTSAGLEDAARQVDAILSALRERAGDAKP